ncbi:MAG TPA: response regulator [Catalimonadaceae bacterium]|nr:response regulator [Catalimonadaceae bacterium]HPI10115.1 response regulator [Catalimonadaceae bacterium]
MNHKIRTVLLIDDSDFDNLFHERVIRKSELVENVIIKTSGIDALEYLIENQRLNRTSPDIIFLDINMPGMNGWEFIEQYQKLEETSKSRVVLVMLTTSENPKDLSKAREYPAISDYKIKPLSKPVLEEVINHYFPEKGKLL